MSKTIEDLEIQKIASEIGDSIWSLVAMWKPFDQDTIGKQLTRAADSIGANLAEAYGRYHFGEKLKRIYYSRGSLFETKFWINRAKARNLLEHETADQITEKLVSLAQRINGFAKFLKQQRVQNSGVKEKPASYKVSSVTDIELEQDVYSDIDIAFLAKLTNNH